MRLSSWRALARARGLPRRLFSAEVPQSRLSDFWYDLPQARIATEPASPRGSSRLLVALPEPGAKITALAQHTRRAVRKLAGPTAAVEGLMDAKFGDLVDLLPPDAHLVFNESRVFAARLFVQRPGEGGGAPIEVMFLSPEGSSSDPTAALSGFAAGQLWRCMVRCADAVEGSTWPVMGDSRIRLRVREVFSAWEEEGEEDGVEAAVEICVDGAEQRRALEIFDELGHIPLPPYMERDARPEDVELYQTVYAKEEKVGSVAAPTAGLHFTDELLAGLDAAGVRRSSVALHVSAGTFRPVVVDTIDDHDMHAETFSASAEDLAQIVASLEGGRPIVPVGTTSSRCLESLYWLGVKELRAPGPPAGHRRLAQWEPYALAAEAREGLPPAEEALRALLAAAEASESGGVTGSTSLCIAPGYAFKLCDGLVTNFHQPDSTLMLLVGALAGGTDQLRRIYGHALDGPYRFLSYGDACFILNAQRAMFESAAGAGAGRREADVARGDLRRAVRELKAADDMRVLLHSCCAPCSGAMIEEMHSAGIDVTVYFYNPNIHPRREYEIRKEENKRYAAKLGIPFVDADYDSDEWYRRAEGMEFAPERGARCTMCFDMRMERTAAYAREMGFTHFTTTNATSRWKDQDQVNDCGRRAASATDGVEYIEYDWQTEEMNARKYKINADNSFYKQEYCGCSYSLRDTNAYRKKEGLDPVQIGGGTVYSDPVADAQEESPEAVASFFMDTHSEANEAWRAKREMYRARRKGEGAEADNW